LVAQLALVLTAAIYAVDYAADFDCRWQRPQYFTTDGHCRRYYISPSPSLASTGHRNKEVPYSNPNPEILLLSGLVQWPPASPTFVPVLEDTIHRSSLRYDLTVSSPSLTFFIVYSMLRSILHDVRR
jgi:hypothetical protein